VAARLAQAFFTQCPGTTISLFFSFSFSSPVLASSLGLLATHRSGSWAVYPFTTHGPRLGSHDRHANDDGSSAIAQPWWTTTTSCRTHHNGHCHLKCATTFILPLSIILGGRSAAASPTSLRGQHRPCGLKATSLCALLWWWWRRPAAAVVGSCARIAAPSAPRHPFRS
jgi:hypothetical protein